ncbi:MAG TPA: hypothetical protein VJA21_21375 [Verrucomicrobiae bacterium]
MKRWQQFFAGAVSAHSPHTGKNYSHARPDRFLRKPAPLLLGQLKSPRGEKTETVLAAIDRQVATFRVADLQAECPGVGVDLIRLLLARLPKEDKVKSLGTGRGAKWEKTGNWVISCKQGNKLRIEFSTMSHAYTEDQLVEQPAIGLFGEVGWHTVVAMAE